ncbi:MAG TPA: hypothetical protein VJS15_00655 [Allosphingosinicella sp.]|nr:hypothetical protein [Allosphingosinicella sp.]
MRTVSLLLSLGLAACATASSAGPMPNRGEVGRALVASLVCVESETVVCHNQPRRAVFTRLRCVPAGEGDFEGVVLCLYVGHMLRADGTRGPIGSDCVYLTRGEAMRWRVAYFPDAEFCES